MNPQQQKAGISASLLPEFDNEMATTRRTLERVPEDKFGWAPHQKSMTLGQLASHIAHTPGWATVAITRDSFDIATEYQPFAAGSRAELLAEFDRNAASARAAIAGASDEALMQPWSLTNTGNIVMTMPKIAVVRTFMMNHGIHHRGQLSVYLRLNDVPVPSIYGPSADEGSM